MWKSQKHGMERNMSVNNCLKILSYIYPITKQVITYDKYRWEPVKSIYLRESLFAEDECKVCGRCCISEDNIFLPFEVFNMKHTLENISDIDTDTHKLNGKASDNIKELLDSLETFDVEINGTSFELFKSKLPPNVYEFEDRGTLKRCHWNLPTEDGRLGCGIHTVSSLTCKMPHIRFWHNSKNLSTSIGHGEYGRNWAMKCPAKVDKTGFSESALNTAIFNFELLKIYCTYFEIDTYVDDILDNLYKVSGDISNIEKVCNKNLVNKVYYRRLI